MRDKTRWIFVTGPSSLDRNVLLKSIERVCQLKGLATNLINIIQIAESAGMLAIELQVAQIPTYDGGYDEEPLRLATLIMAAIKVLHANARFKALTSRGPTLSARSTSVSSVIDGYYMYNGRDYPM